MTLTKLKKVDITTTSDNEIKMCEILTKKYIIKQNEEDGWMMTRRGLTRNKDV